MIKGKCVVEIGFLYFSVYEQISQKTLTQVEIVTIAWNFPPLGFMLEAIIVFSFHTEFVLLGGKKKATFKST